MYGSRSSSSGASTERDAGPGLNRGGSMVEIFPQGAGFGVAAGTVTQAAPPSPVTCPRPSVEPAQITPACCGDSAMANSVAPSNVMRLSVVTPPELCWCVVSFRVRSGLITFQLAPPSVVTCTYWLPTYTRA